MDSHNPRLHRLYLAKSMKELNNMVEEIPSANPKLLLNSGQKVLKQAYILEERNDEEKAYVMFMRYFSIAATIQKHPEYKKNKKYYDTLMDPKTTSKVIVRAETLHKSLERRYNLMNTAVTSEIIEEKKFIHNLEEHNEAEKIKQQEAREADEEKRKQEKARKGINEDEGTITCQKLYCLVKEKCSSFLILDIRQSDHFNETRMKINNVINIPEEIIKPGLTAGRIGSELSHHSRAMWLSLRHKVDYLIICDWDFEEPPLTQPINTLIDAMLRWDPGKKYASRPWVLKAGFEMWRLMYPIHTTNPQFKRPPPVKEDVAEEFDDLDFEYPDLDQAFNKTPVDKTPDPGNNTPFGHNVNGWDSNNCLAEYGMQHGSYGSQPVYGGLPAQRPTVNRGLKPSMSNDDTPNNNAFANSKNTEKNYDMRTNIGANVNSWDHKDINKLVDQNRADVGSETPPVVAGVVPVIPSRSLKPEVALASLAANKTVMDAEQRLLEESVALEEHALEKLRQKEETTSAREKTQDETTRHKLQETEDRLNIEIESLKSQSQIMEERYSQVQQQNKELWHLVNQVLAGQVRHLNVEGPAASDAKLDPKEQQKQDNATKQSEEELRQSELKRRAMQERVENMRRERKEKERKLKQVQKLKDKGDNETERGSPLRQLDKNDADTRISRYISDSGDIYTAPLKRSPRSSPVRGGSNLKRSHSAFNISRLEDDESISTSKSVQKPTIERSMKPLNVTPRRNNFNIARQRNFDPKIGKVGGNRTGLKNLGNTCYMNSIIQCLNNTTVLVKYFVEDNYCDDINENSRQRGELAEELGAVIKAMWCNQYRSIALWDLKNAVSKFHKPFQGYDQHDAHEFLIKLMDWLREDLNKVRQKIPPMKEQNHDGIPDYIAAGKVETEFRRRDQSIIFASFHGLHRSSIECGTCKHRSLTFEPFSILTLSFPATGRSSSLRDMLNHYYTDSNIEYTCSKCKKMRNCVRKTDIWKLPPLLIIHLNRFEHDVLMRKKQNYVDFPLENLDLSSYVGMNNNSSSRYSNFDLYGISNHYGTMDGGHYTAFCKSKGNNNWYKFDDHEVYELSRESVKTPAAYILFYETRQLSVNLNR